MEKNSSQKRTLPVLIALSAILSLLVSFQNCGVRGGLDEQAYVGFAMANPRPLTSSDLEKFTIPCGEVAKLNDPQNPDTCMNIYVNERFPQDIGNGLHPEFPVSTPRAALDNATVYFSHPDLDNVGKKLVINVQEGQGEIPQTSSSIGFSISVVR